PYPAPHRGRHGTGVGHATRRARAATPLTRRGERRIKDFDDGADPKFVSEGAVADRRAASPRTEAPRRTGMLRRLAAALRDGLYRRLAEDDDRAAYWIRHVRNGVLLSQIAAVAALGYVLLTPTAAHDSPVLIGMATSIGIATPLLLRLPLAAMMRDHRGPMLFYGWSILVTAIVTIASRVDGGAASPLFSLMFLTLAYMAVAYPPCGVVAVGGIMTGSYLLLVALPHLTLTALFYAVVMASFTTICAMASTNSWAAYDRQVLLIRTQETLATTDSLTGIPNRRAFIDRLSAAVNAAAWGHQTVVCLVDLDGFKAVNDAAGHAAGDAMLRSVGAALGAAVRETDTVARLGGDEFAVLADISVAFSAEELAERLRQAVAAVGGPSGVTASVGVAEVQPGDDVEDLMHRADAAMYRSKSAGGNRVTSLAF
ncbi:MAG: diguanylate cyclase domain-containing protein, partial [Blastococcus sp.]